MPLPRVRLRPPRDTGAVPGVRYNPRRMSRVPRFLLNAATAVSALLFVATVVLWVRSYFVVDVLGWQYADRRGFTSATTGALQYFEVRRYEPPEAGEYHGVRRA